MRLVVLALIGGALLSGDATAATSCRNGGRNHPEISCRQITEHLLLGMRGASREKVVQALAADGRTNSGGLHFDSHYADQVTGRFSNVDFGFNAKNQVVSIASSIYEPSDPMHEVSGPATMVFIWKASGSFLCSDFPDSTKRCYPKNDWK